MWPVSAVVVDPVMANLLIPITIWAVMLSRDLRLEYHGKADRSKAYED
jgi:hypothetical protein